MKEMSVKKKTIIAVAAAAALTGMLGTGIFAAKTLTGNDKKTTISFEEKDRNEELGSEKNPYTILEVVPNTAMATVGYLVPGSEPIGEEGMAKIVADDTNGELINMYYSLFGTEESISNVYRKSRSLFKLDANSSEINYGIQYDNSKIGQEIDGITQEGYGEYGYFRYVGTGGSFTYVPPSTSSNNDFRFNHVEGGSGEWDWVAVGKYTQDGIGSYSISQIANRSVTREGKFTDSNMSLGNKWFETGNSDAVVKYRLDMDSELMQDSQTYLDGRGIVFQFNDGTAITRYYSDPEEFISTMSTGVVPDVSASELRYYTDRCERYWLHFNSNTIDNKDALIGTIFPGEKSVKNGGKIHSQVITVTPKMLSQFSGNDLITLSYLPDMIVFHQMSGASGEGGYVDAAALYDLVNETESVRGVFNQDNDIPSAMLTYLLNREAGGKTAAIIFDNNTVKDKSASNLFKLYGTLNEKGAKYAFNVWYSKPTEANPEGKPSGNWNELNNQLSTFSVRSGFDVGASNFVFDFDGNLSYFTTNAMDPTTIENDIAEDKPKLQSAFSTHVLPKLAKMDDVLKSQFATSGSSSGFSSMSMVGMLATMQNEAWHLDYKDKLRILEVEPTYKYVSDYDPKKPTQRKWVKQYLEYCPWFIGTTQDLAKDVTIDKICTRQLVGDIRDLNEYYDIIYFGTEQDFRNGIEGYNDDNMNNYNNGSLVSSLVYTAAGDYINSRLWYAVKYDNQAHNDRGWSKWPANNGKNNVGVNGDGNYAAARKGSEYYQVSQRYTGSDITRKKAVQIENFAYSGAVIFSDSFFEYPGVDNGTISATLGDVNRYLIDERSEIYYLANNSKTATSDISPFYNNNAMFGEKMAKYDNGLIVKESGGLKNADPVSHVDLKNQGQLDETTSESLGYPVEYSYNKGVNPDKTTNVLGTNIYGVIEKGTQTSNDQKNDYNQDVLRFTFKLDGVRDVPYQVRLCMDTNGNGIFEGDLSYEEEMNAFDGNKTLAYSSEEANITRNSIRDITEEFNPLIVNNGELLAGHTYEISRVIPDDTSGAIPYKLEIFERDNSKKRGVISGITRVAKKSRPVKVLCMNLTHNMASDPTNNAKFYDESGWIGKSFRTYLDAASDFNVYMDYLANGKNSTGSSYYQERKSDDTEAILKITPEGKSFTNDFANNEEYWTNFLTQYDMIILGYRDMAQFTSNKVFRAGFNEFVSEGKSVIMSHDMIIDNGPWDNNYLNDVHKSYLNNVNELRAMCGQLKKTFIPGTNNYSYSTIYMNGNITNPYRATVSNLPIDIAEQTPSVVSGSVSSNYYDAENQFMLNNGRLILRQGWMPVGDLNNPEGAQIRSNATWDHYDANGNLVNVWGFLGDNTARMNIWRAGNKGYDVSSEQYVRYFYNSSLSGRRAADGDKGNVYRIADNDTDFNYLLLSDAEKASYEPANVTSDNNYRSLAFSRTMPQDRRNIFGALTGMDTEAKAWNYLTSDIKKANDGQITRYPYDLRIAENNNGIIKVGQTHTQNYALDLDFDATDDDKDGQFDGDVVVWYNLAGGTGYDKKVDGNNTMSLYDTFSGDSANNYYIYTKGNLTYTGFGHGASMTDKEIRLFVNCMISSFRAPASPPYAEVENDDTTVNNGDYIVYVEDLGDPNIEGSYASTVEDFELELRINDDSLPSKYKKQTYTLTVTDKDGNIIDEYELTPVQRDGTYVVHIPYKDLYGNGENRFNLKVDSEYITVNDTVINLTKTTTVNLIFMPFFDLY